jgi:photosystem II stability/assembly factor-like uncharacterized protein
MKRWHHKLLGLILLVLSACGGAGDSSTTEAWVSVASSGSVIVGTDFITSQGNTMATGGVTSGVSGTFDISFSDSETGWFVGNLGEVLKTTDGGGTAELLGIGTSSRLYGVFALDSNNIVIAGQDSANDGASIFYSTDGGATWTTPANTALTYLGRSIFITDRLRGVDFNDANNGLVVGGLGDNTSIIWQTSDGGATWAEVYHATTTGTDDELSSVAYLSSSDVVAVGNTGVILTSADGGATWTEQDSGTTENLYKTKCFDELTCLAVGGAGTLLQTSDSGATWAAISSGTAEDLNALAVNGDEAWVGGSAGTMLYSADNGTTWAAQVTDTDYPIQAIHMLSTTSGFAGAANTSSNTGAILHTSTGGL